MRELPKISVITVSLNSAATIESTINSVASQNYPNIEYIIVDGLSSDNTLEIVRRYGEVVHTVLAEKDDGIYDAMNKGIARVTGELVGIINADDYYASPEVLARVARAFENPEIMCCYGDLEYVKTAGEASCGCYGSGSGLKGTNPGFVKVVRYWRSGPYRSDLFYWGWMPPHPTFFVRRSLYECFGTFRTDMGSAADYELMLRFLLKYGQRAAYIPEVLVKMRTGGASGTSLAARFAANRMDRRAWTLNALTPYPWTMLCKPLRKVGQFLLKRDA